MELSEAKKQQNKYPEVTISEMWNLLKLQFSALFLGHCFLTL